MRLSMLPAVVLLLTACDASMRNMPADSVVVTSHAGSGVREIATDAALGVAMAPAVPAMRPPRSGKAIEESAPTFVAPSTMVIRNGSVTVEVDSLEAAIDRVRQLAQSMGGYLGNVAMQTGKHQVRSATLEMKIPAGRFDGAMTGMPVLGKVEQSTSTAEDVGEEWVDVGARVANSKRLESRLVTLLATRTGKLEDVLTVERELARVRQEIERYEGRMRFLSSRVATSTIYANVHEKAPIIAAAPGPNVFVTAFVNMGRNFVRFLTATIELLGILAPVGVLVWVIALGWRRWRRGRIVATA